MTPTLHARVSILKYRDPIGQTPRRPGTHARESVSIIRSVLVLIDHALGSDEPTKEVRIGPWWGLLLPRPREVDQRETFIVLKTREHIVASVAATNDGLDASMERMRCIELLQAFRVKRTGGICIGSNPERVREIHRVSLAKRRAPGQTSQRVVNGRVPHPLRPLGCKVIRLRVPRLDRPEPHGTRV